MGECPRTRVRSNQAQPTKEAQEGQEAQEGEEGQDGQEGQEGQEGEEGRQEGEEGQTVRRGALPSGKSSGLLPPVCRAAGP